MELKDQVCTLEQAKRLKELMVPQYVNFYWMINDAEEPEFKTRAQMEELCTEAILEKKKEEAGIKDNQWHSYDEAAFEETGVKLFKESCSLPDNEVFFAAYTASELGEMLPCESGIISWDVSYNDHQGQWECRMYDLLKWVEKPRQSDIPPTAYESEGDTMAEAMAEALIHCLENKLVTPHS